MAAVLSFKTSRFVNADEPENPINSLRGHALLSWLRDHCATLGLIAGAEIKAKDSGWYLDADVFAEPYRFGCGREQEAVYGQEESEAWSLSLSARRSLVDRLLGRGKLTADNAVLRLLLEILERQADFEAIEWRLE